MLMISESSALDQQHLAASQPLSSHGGGKGALFEGTALSYKNVLFHMTRDMRETKMRMFAAAC